MFRTKLGLPENQVEIHATQNNENEQSTRRMAKIQAVIDNNLCDIGDDSDKNKNKVYQNDKSEDKNDQKCDEENNTNENASCRTKINEPIIPKECHCNNSRCKTFKNIFYQYLVNRKKGKFKINNCFLDDTVAF